SWFGDRQKCSTLAVSDGREVALTLLQRTGHLSLYGHTDVQPLLGKLSWFRFVAHEFRFPTAKQNHDAAERELEALRRQLAAAGVKLDGVAFVAQGSDAPRQEPVTES